MRFNNIEAAEAEVQMATDAYENLKRLVAHLEQVNEALWNVVAAARELEQWFGDDYEVRLQPLREALRALHPESVTDQTVPSSIEEHHRLMNEISDWLRS